MNPAELKTDKIGIVYLKVDGDSTKYPCTSARIVFAMNTIAQASVVVGGGVPLDIKNGSSRIVQPERILDRLISMSSGRQRFLACELYEDEYDESGTHGNRRIFTGYIVSGGVNYKAGPPGAFTIQFDCMSYQCLLLVSPVSAFTLAQGVKLIYRDNTGKPITLDTMTKPDHAMSAISFAQRLEMFASQLAGQKLDTILAHVMAFVVHAASLLPAGDSLSDNEDEHTRKLVEDSIFSNYRINDSATYTTESYANKLWVTELGNELYGSITGSSLFEAIVSAMMSDSRLLNLVPRWSKHADKEHAADIMPMELVPDICWNTSAYGTINIKTKWINSVSYMNNAQASLNTPDVVIASFRSNNYDTFDGSTAPIGMACANNQLNSVLRANRNNLERVFSESSGYRVKEVTAPKWLHDAAMASREIARGEIAGGNISFIPKYYIPKTEAEAQNAYVQKLTVDNYISTSVGQICTSLADDIAQAILIRNYMMLDSCTVTLLPSARFGGTGEVFENSLGKMVKIDLSDMETTEGSDLSVTGMLTSIVYQYSAAERSTSSYVLGLSRVHPSEVRIRDLNCPIYMRA